MAGADRWDLQPRRAACGGGALVCCGARGDSQPMIYRAVPVVTPSSEELAEYAGTYASTELGTAYTILLDSDKLVWRRRKFTDTVLTPTVADEFSADGWIQMAFTRDQENRVSGMTVTTGRVRGLRLTSQ